MFSLTVSPQIDLLIWLKRTPWTTNIREKCYIQGVIQIIRDILAFLNTDFDAFLVSLPERALKYSFFKNHFTVQSILGLKNRKLWKEKCIQRRGQKSARKLSRPQCRFAIVGNYIWCYGNVWYSLLSSTKWEISMTYPDGNHWLSNQDTHFYSEFHGFRLC